MRNALFFLAVLCPLFLFVPSSSAILYSEAGDTVVPAWYLAPAATQIGLSDLGLAEGDDIDALSLGDDPLPEDIGDGTRIDIFAVAPGASGTSGELMTRAAAAVAVERDVYRETTGDTNEVLIPELIPDGALDAFDHGDFDPEGNQWLYFSLAEGSPTLAANGWSADDVLMVHYPTAGTLQLFADDSLVGTPGDIDALSVKDHVKDGSPYDPSVDMIIYSTAANDGQVHHYGAGSPAGNIAHAHGNFGVDSLDNIVALEHIFYLMPRPSLRFLGQYVLTSPTGPQMVPLEAFAYTGSIPTGTTVASSVGDVETQGTCEEENTSTLEGPANVRLALGEFTLALFHLTPEGDHRVYSGGSGQILLGDDVLLSSDNFNIVMDVGYDNTTTGWGIATLDADDPVVSALRDEFTTGTDQVAFVFNSFSPVVQEHVGVFDFDITVKPAAVPQFNVALPVLAAGNLDFAGTQVAMDIAAFQAGGMNADQDHILVRRIMDDPGGAAPAEIAGVSSHCYWEIGTVLASMTASVTFDLSDLPDSPGTENIKMLRRDGNGGAWVVYADQAVVDATHILAEGVTGYGQWAIGIVTAAEPAVPGDIDASSAVDLGDTILALQVLTQADAAGAIDLEAVVSGDGRVGLPEAIYAMRAIRGEGEGLTEAERLATQKAVNATALAFADGYDSVDDLSGLALISSAMGLAEAQQAAGNDVQSFIQSLLGLTFPCGTVENQLTTLIFTFTGGQDCPNISGTVSVTPSLVEGGLSFHMVYDNVDVDGCVINGSADTTLVVEGSLVTATHVFDSMTICGQSVTGTATVTYDAAGQVVAVTRTSQNIYDLEGAQVTVTTNLTYHSDTGLSGTALISGADEQDYEAAFENIMIDPTCGLPTSGTLTVNGIEMDFSGTTCENPSVSVTYNGVTVVVSLEEAMAIFLSAQQSDPPATANVLSLTSSVDADTLVVTVNYGQEVPAGTDATQLQPRIIDMSLNFEHGILEFVSATEGQAAIDAEKGLTTQINEIAGTDWTEGRFILMNASNTNRVAPGELVVIQFRILQTIDTVLKWDLPYTNFAPAEADEILGALDLDVTLSAGN